MAERKIHNENLMDVFVANCEVGQVPFVLEMESDGFRVSVDGHYFKKRGKQKVYRSAAAAIRDGMKLAERWGYTVSEDEPIFGR